MVDLPFIQSQLYIPAPNYGHGLSTGQVATALLPLPLISDIQVIQVTASQLWFTTVLILILVAVMIVFIFKRWPMLRHRARLQERSELRQQLVQSEMRALRSQMNPHFIFNAINSIQHYVLTNEKELANKYLVKFSRLMRNILELSKEEQISLKDELETAKLYLEIEALRFNNAFTFSIKCEEGIDQSALKLPPLLIQPFIENAIWHGLLLKEGDKSLSITVKKLNTAFEIAIDDNGIGREMSGRFRNEELKRRSFGMDITTERLEVLKKAHGMDISVKVIDKTENGESAGTRVVVHIDPPKKTT